MTMRKLLILTLLAAALGTNAANNIAPGIDRYVGSQARPVRVAKPQYNAAGTKVLSLQGGKQIVEQDIRTGQPGEVVFDVATARDCTLSKIEGFTVSPDGSKILVWAGSTPIYRHSYTAEYFVYDLHSKKLTPVAQPGEQLRAPLFSPDGRMIAYVKTDNNIYIYKLDYGTTVSVTTDGAVNSVINGVPDWVYEEEFATDCSMTWSPDNLMLCYIKYDESEVPLYSFPLYEGACEPRKQYALYPGQFTYKYPVAGQPNSRVSVHGYDIETRATKTVALNDANIEYIPRITFAYAADRLMVVTLNRAQNRMELYAVNPRSTVAKSVLVEQEKAWLNPATYEEITFTADGFVMQSSRNGYSNYYQYTYSGQMTRAITNATYDATAYYGYDAKTQRHFFQATPTGPLNRVLCSVDAKGNIKHLTPDEGTASAWFTPNMDYYTVNYSNVTTPPTYTLYATSGDKQQRVVEANAEYAAKYANAPRKEFFQFTTADGVSLNGFMVKPLDFNASKKYPVIMYQYSGPGSQEVLNRWGVDWANYFAEQGFIIVTVDGRGTGGRGREFMDIVYRNLGKYETIDQCATASYLASLPYVDGSRIGLWGWSYGGYETLMCLTTGTFDWACGVAVAPVTSWRYYDTVYAERYMLTPGENEAGYNSSAPLTHAADLRAPLLMIHGTADDNVHLSNTIEFVSALEVSGGYCDMLLFPNMNHSIYGCNSRAVIYSRILSYFTDHLK